MWNPPFGFQNTWQRPQFSQANIGQAVPRQPLGLSQQGLSNRPPAIPQPHGVYYNLSQTPLNQNRVVMAQQHPSHRPTSGGPLLPSQLQFPRQPLHVQPNNSLAMQPRVNPPPMNPQFPIPPMHVNQLMNPRGIGGQHSPFLPHPTNPPFPRIPMEVAQSIRMRSAMANPSVMHNLPPPSSPNMHSTPTNGNSQPTVALRGREPQPPGTFVSNSNHFPNPIMQIEPQRNERNVSQIHSAVDMMPVDPQNNIPSMSTSNYLFDIPTASGQNKNEIIDYIPGSGINEQDSYNTFTSDQSKDQQRTREILTDKDHRHVYHDEMDAIEYGYGLSPPEMDSMALTDAEDEVFPTSPRKKPEERSPIKNDYRKREDHGFSRKRGSDRHHSSSRHSHKQPKYDNDLKYIDHDKSCSPNDGKSIIMSSERKYRTSSKHVDHDKDCSPHDQQRDSTSSEGKRKTRSKQVDHDKGHSPHDDKRSRISSEGKSKMSSKESKHIDHDKGHSPHDDKRSRISSEGKSKMSSKESKHIDHDKRHSPHDDKRSRISSGGKSKMSSKESKHIDHDKRHSPHDDKISRISSEGKSKMSSKESKHIDHDKRYSPHDDKRSRISSGGKSKMSSKESKHIDHGSGVIPHDRKRIRTSSEGKSRTRSKHDDQDKGCSPHDEKKGSTSSKRRNRTSSSSSNNSPHCKINIQRRKELFTSPRPNGLDRHHTDTRHHREDRPLRCVSPPAPDIKRVLKFKIPEDYYTRSKSKKDSKSVSLGTQKLEELYETFEKKILNPTAERSEPDSEEQSLNSKEARLQDGTDSGKMNDDDDDDIYSDFDSPDDFDLREQERNGEYSAETFNDANDSDESAENDDDDDKYDVDDDTSDSSSDEAGRSAKEDRARKLSDPRRLHPDLWFNEKGEGNDGPVCRCCPKDSERGIQHFVYPGEKSIPLCDPLCNNADRLYHYWVTVTPHTNFMTEIPTTIKYHDRHFVFEGFSILSHQSLDKIPLCSLIRFNIEFSLHLVREPIPMNFCVKGLEMISKFLFSDVLELLDWSLKGQEGEEESCPIFHFMPRFVCRKKESQNGKEVHELLPMNKVISYFIDSCEPLVKPEHLKMSKQKEISLSKSCRNLIVRRPNKKPASFRIDDLEFEDEDDTEHNVQRTYPLAIHHGIRPVQMSYSGNAKYQKLWKSFLRLRNTAANRPVFSRKYQDRLVEMKVKLEKMRLNSSMRRDVEVKVSSRGLMKTGIHSDICQHAMLLPVLVHHVRYHISLRTLDDNIGYRFKDRMLLQLSLSHPSYHLNFGMNPDQARNTLSNCGVKHPRYGDRRIHRIHTKKKGITQLIRVMANLGKIEEHHSIFEDRHGSLCKVEDSSDGSEGSAGRQINTTQTEMIRHNERLEFLGDAVLEFICSSHLYFMLPEKTEGHLANFRSALVQNSHLTRLAKRLNLSDYMQYAHGPDLCKEEDMNHAMANCFEALLGAIFLESGLQAAIDFLSRVAFENEEIRSAWVDLPQHPLQSQQPQGDRHLIPSSPVLQKLHELEESTGITFNHIRLLARAFTHPQVGFNNLTLGDNQRMEFLGDSVLQFVISVYLYKHFPEHHEGHLTLLRSSLVNNRTQADIARHLGLDEYINFGSSGPKNIREKLLADVLEAFLAALYIDKGLKHVEAFCRACFFPRVEENIVNQEWIDAKSQLQQCCLSLREEGKTPDLPEYRVLQNAGPAHRKRYQIVVYYKGKRCGKGDGQSIHQAEMEAARDALSSSYFPELARQKHYLDEKHQNRRTRQHNNRSSRPRATPDEEPPVQEPLWVDNE